MSIDQRRSTESGQSRYASSLAPLLLLQDRGIDSTDARDRSSERRSAHLDETGRRIVVSVGRDSIASPSRASLEPTERQCDPRTSALATRRRAARRAVRRDRSIDVATVREHRTSRGRPTLRVTYETGGADLGSSGLRSRAQALRSSRASSSARRSSTDLRRDAPGTRHRRDARLPRPGPRTADEAALARWRRPGSRG